MKRLQDSGADVLLDCCERDGPDHGDTDGIRHGDAPRSRSCRSRFLDAALPPTDPDFDGAFEDVNGNQRRDFADVVSVFNNLNWIAANEPVVRFDFNHNGRMDFADVVSLFNTI